mmetsp:Transcript_14835/g.35933  ORF Transcript_14835/g.35933 Transcript_14835/m.35933 type:complete len:647 (+) Transcript_14835:96-2036(+)
MSMLSDAMNATERLYDNSVGVFNDCLTSPKKEEAVIADTSDNSAILRHLLEQTNPSSSIPIYSYESDEEEVKSQDLVLRIQERLKEDKAQDKKSRVLASLDRAARMNEPSSTTGNNGGINLELLCSHEQYGLDMCMFLLSPNSPLHNPDYPRDQDPNPAQEDGVVVQENDTNDNDESWFGIIDCGKVLCGDGANYNTTIAPDEKTAATAISDSSRDGSTTIDDSLGEFSYESSSKEGSELLQQQQQRQQRATVPPNALATHLKGLIAKNNNNSSSKEDEKNHLECNNQSILSGEIQIPTEEPPEPVGRSMTEPSDDDYLMLLQTDPKGTSFCTDDDSFGGDNADADDEESEADDLCPKYAKHALRPVPPVPQEEFSPRQNTSSDSMMHLDPDGASIAPMDEVSAQGGESVQGGGGSECEIVDNTNTTNKEEEGIELIHLEILAADLIQENDGSVSSSLWSQRALLDDDHDSVLNENSWEAYREPDGTKFADDIVLSRAVLEDNTVDDIIKAMSKEEDAGSVVFSEPFDETEDNFCASSPTPPPRLYQKQQQERQPESNQTRLTMAQLVDGAHCAFELPNSRKPKTNLEKRLTLLEKLRGLSDSDTDMLCACVQGCGDFADATFFEGCADEENASQEGETVEQLSLD